MCYVVVVEESNPPTKTRLLYSITVATVQYGSYEGAKKMPSQADYSH